MTSASDVSRHGEIRTFDSGTQVLASLSSMQSPLTELPAGAYNNLLVISSKSPDDVERRLADAGAATSNVGLIPLSRESHDYDGPLWTNRAIAPDDLTGISIAYTQALSHLGAGSGWVLFEDLGVLTMYADTGRVIRLLSHVADRARSNEIRGLYGVVRDAVSDETYHGFRQAVDREVDFR